MTQSTASAPQRRRPRKKIPMWQRVLFRWRLPLIIVLILMILVGVIVGLLSRKQTPKDTTDQDEQPLTTTQLFENAMADAVRAQVDEIKPLVTLTAENELCSLDESGQVTLVIWHNQPDTYVKGQSVSLPETGARAFTDKEILSWAKNHKQEVTGENGVLRLEQLLGLAPSSGNTYFAVVKTDASKVIRPAYQTDPTKDEMTIAFSTEPDEAYRTWFNNTILSSYFGTADYAWTRLGYTYDWAENSTEYGVTEFLIPANSTATVLENYTNEEFRTLLGQGRELVAS